MKGMALRKGVSLCEQIMGTKGSDSMEFGI